MLCRSTLKISCGFFIRFPASAKIMARPAAAAHGFKYAHNPLNSHKTGFIFNRIVPKNFPNLFKRQITPILNHHRQMLCRQRLKRFARRSAGQLVGENFKA
jgi:molybdopterin-biosynthesis enzyme MoeA-like protein